jgi:ribosomal protein L22
MIPISQKIIVQVNRKMRAELVVDDINILENVMIELAMCKGNVQKDIANINGQKGLR